MMINGNTQVYGVIGDPIRHSLSPQLHNAVFSDFKKNRVYLAFEVHSDDLFDAVESLRSLGIKGINVTIPHKEKIMNFLDEIPQSLDRAIGAVNTVVIKDRRLIGFNTDGPAFITDLKEQFNFDPQGKMICIAGSGGAARAVALYLLQMKCETLHIHNRARERAEGLVKYLKDAAGDNDVRVLEDWEKDTPKSMDLIINATSCGMKLSDPLPIPVEIIKRSSHLYDLIYSPKETKLITEAKGLGLKVAGGLGMLIHQASLSQQIWFPSEEEPKKIVKAMRSTYAKCGG